MDKKYVIMFSVRTSDHRGEYTDPDFEKVLKFYNNFNNDKKYIERLIYNTETGEFCRISDIKLIEKCKELSKQVERMKKDFKKIAAILGEYLTYEK